MTENTRTWNYGFCEHCIKNAHEKVKMKREETFSEDRTYSEVWWVCPRCGSTKKL